jgi:hypothetical protein
MSYNDWQDWELSDSDKALIDIAARDANKTTELRTELRKTYPALTHHGFMTKVSARKAEIETERVKEMERRLGVLEGQEAVWKREHDELRVEIGMLKEQIGKFKACMAELLK